MRERQLPDGSLASGHYLDQYFGEGSYSRRSRTARALRERWQNLLAHLGFAEPVVSVGWWDRSTQVPARAVRSMKHGNGTQATAPLYRRRSWLEKHLGVKLPSRTGSLAKRRLVSEIPWRYRQRLIRAFQIEHIDYLPGGDETICRLDGRDLSGGPIAVLGAPMPDHGWGDYYTLPASDAGDYGCCGAEEFAAEYVRV